MHFAKVRCGCPLVECGRLAQSRDARKIAEEISPFSMRGKAPHSTKRREAARFWETKEKSGRSMGCFAWRRTHVGLMI